MSNNYEYQRRPVAKFNEKGFAAESGYVKVHCMNLNTREYVGPREEYVSKSTGLAAGSFFDAPKEAPVGYAICRNEEGTAWVFVIDHRGKVCYVKQNGYQINIDYIGEIKEEHTFLAPTTPFDEWANDRWHTNLAKQKQYLVNEASERRYRLLDIAGEHISHIKSAIEANDATPEEEGSLAAWEAYKRALYRLNPSKAPNIEWPENKAKFILHGFELE